MTSDQFSIKQLETLLHTLRRQQSYLARLTGRMSQKHFPRSDPIVGAASEAEQATARLVNALDYLKQKLEK